MAGIPHKDLIFSEQLTFRQILPADQKILAAMGYGTDCAPEFVKTELARACEFLDKLDDICGGFQVFFSQDFCLEARGFKLGNIFFHTGEIIAANLRDSEYVVFLITTAGQQISNAITRANENQELLQAYVYDVIGSEIAEAVADRLQSRLAADCSQWSLKITHRYSPGYCNWDVAEQYKLFKFLPPLFCGVSLSASALMRPLKSVSCVIGIGKNAVKRNYGCSICTLDTCYKRKNIKNKEGKNGN